VDNQGPQSQVMKPITNDNFVAYLRSALHNLYDLVHLRRSPLVGLLGLAGEFDAAGALQERLTNAIKAIKPPAEEPAQSIAWHVYDILNLQYYRQLSRTAVAMQLGISERQLRREQRLALETLAQYLRKQYAQELAGPAAPPGTAEPQPSPTAALEAELGWLRGSMAEQRSPLAEGLHMVRTLAEPLAQRWNTSLEVRVDEAAVSLPVVQPIIRSILLTLLNVAIPRSGGQPVMVTATYLGGTTQLAISLNQQDDVSQPFAESELASLEAASRLAAYYGADLALIPPGVVVTLPAPELIPVLVVDDNADWLDLLRRYAFGSRYAVTGTRDADTAPALAARLRPAVIVVDVMMPNTDGWQLISWLRHDEATAHVPIVICSVLPLEALALSLGVNAFIQKPITQGQFLAMIDAQVRG
jgi:CheY-like chemotaxis protein